MQVRRVAALGLLVLPLLGVAVHARAEGKPEVQLSMTAEKEVTVKEGDKQVVKRVPATTSAPGDVLIYTAVPPGSGRRLGIDRDRDLWPDRNEATFGTDPADPHSNPWKF